MTPTIDKTVYNKLLTEMTSQLIQGQRSINKVQAKALADYFQISINLFI